MKKIAKLTKTLLVAAGLCVGANAAWATDYTWDFTNTTTWTTAKIATGSAVNLATDGKAPEDDEPYVTFTFAGADNYGAEVKWNAASSSVSGTNLWYAYNGSISANNVSIVVPNNQQAIFYLKLGSTTRPTVYHLSNESAETNHNITSGNLVYRNTTGSDVTITMWASNTRRTSNGTTTLQNGIVSIVLGDITHDYSINAVANISGVKTTISTIATGMAAEGNDYSTYVPKVVNYGGSYYVLDDGSNESMSGYKATYTMGDANVTKEINYTLDETILYYAEAENMTTSKKPTVSSGDKTTCSKGQAWCSYAAEGSYFKSALGLSYPIYADIEAGLYGRKKTTATLQLINSESATTNLGTQALTEGGYQTWSANKTLIPAGSEFYVANDNGEYASKWALDYVIIRRATFTVADEANVVGAKNYSTEASGAYSADYTMKKGDTKVFTFKNHGTTFGNNYRITVKEGETWKSNTRADFYDETGGYHLDFDLTDDIDDWAVMSSDGGSTKTGLNWDNFASDMADATVVATLVYGVDGKLTINAVSTGTTPGYKYYVHNEISGLSSNLTINLSVNHSWLEVLSVEQTAVGSTIASSGYSSLASANGLNFAGIDGLTAFVVTNITKDAVTLTSVNELPASSGVILKGTAGTTYSIPVKAGATYTRTNMLQAAVEATPIEANQAYILQGGLFCLVTAASTVPAGKAYLLADDVPSQARALNFLFGDEASGINDVLREMQSGEFYNLSGQRVAAPKSGLYIVNGKKVIIK